ncbi:MAG TPA: BTAD domain-containing putative transcriptional regulator, partial [Mycobacterium sp.]|nr:BTAD domain-containing putative transcriptional regulator [Mycobacterium sp.]
MRYRLLGPLRVTRGDVPVDIGPPKQRAVLAVLLLAQGRVVSVDRLIDAVWGEDVPGSATASLQAYVSNLRRALRGGAEASDVASPIVRQSPGYYLDVAPEDVDVAEFTTRCARAGAAIDEARWDDALSQADAAIALWRGPFLADLRDEEWVGREAARVDELHRDCLDSRITALLALGRAPAALAEAAELSAAHPLSDRACWLHVLALYRSGRTSDALGAYTRHARVLDDELGLEPGAELRDLQTAVLRQAPELAAWPRSPEWTGAVELNATPTPAVLSAPVAASAQPQLTLIGRHRELATVAEVLADAAGGDTRWLVLSGPPGIGKTRLAEEAVALAAAGGGQTVWVSCPDERATPPWWPMRQLVRALEADVDEVLEIAAHADPDTARFQVYERIQRLVESSSGLRAIVVDDVQWADSASVSCLAYIAGALRDHPIVMILTMRD